MPRRKGLAAQIGLIAAHELRLAWRDFHSMMTARRRWRARTVVFWILAIAGILHTIAYGVLEAFTADGLVLDEGTLVSLGGMLLLTLAMMLSQAIEGVTRVFYARGDLELLLSSPLDTSAVCAVRIGTIALTSGLMTIAVVAPFVNVAALMHGHAWLATYLVVPALGAAATAIAVIVTLLLFRAFGARRTRLAAQIVSAVVGAVFIVGVNLVAILAFQGYSRLAVFQSETVRALAPDAASLLWWPVRALAGEEMPLVATIATCLCMLLAVTALLARRFGPLTLEAGAASAAMSTDVRAHYSFTTTSASRALRQKEWLLLRRDPWLVSQSLMQIFYLLPPAVLLWTQFGSDAADGAGVAVVAVPVLVMAAGQLAGGLAWLAVSGEDAPDLVASAPIEPGLVLRAKVEAVVGAVSIVVLPLIGFLALYSVRAALIGLLAVIFACASATAIQLWHRGQAQRRHFRYRQTTSRIAALCEAAATIAWAGTAGLLVYGTAFAAIPAMLALIALLLAHSLGPGGGSPEHGHKPVGNPRLSVAGASA